MAEVLLASDIHVHPHKQYKKSNERLYDCLKALEWIFKVAEEREIKNILFLGDLFHDRQKIDVLTYQKTFEIFEKHKDASVYLLLGNHDLWHANKWDISSVFPLRALSYVTVIDRPCTLDIAGWPVSFVPYSHNPLEDIRLLKSAAPVLCGHLAINGALLNSFGTISDVSVEHDGNMIKVGADSFHGWDQVFLGHYHTKQQIAENAEYIGSPLELSFGEANCDKHIIVYDLKTGKKEYVKNTFSPKHLFIKPSEIDNYDLENNFIQIITEENTDSADLVELTKVLVEKHKVGSLEIRPVKKENEENIVLDAKAILLKENELVEYYVNELKKNDALGNLKVDLATKVGKILCEFSLTNCTDEELVKYMLDKINNEQQGF